MLGSDNVGVNPKLLDEYLNSFDGIRGNQILFNRYLGCHDLDLVSNKLGVDRMVIYFVPGHAALVDKVKIWNNSGKFKIFFNDPNTLYPLSPLTNKNMFKRNFRFYELNFL